MATPTPLPRYERILTGHERRQRGRCWRPEGTDDWLLIHTLAGRAHVMLPDGQLSLGAGETLLFRPSAPQDFGGDAASGLWELAWVHFLPLPHWLELLRWPEIAPGILRMAVSEPSLRERIETRLLEADRLSGSGLRYADRLAQNALESALLWWEVQNSLGARSTHGWSRPSTTSRAAWTGGCRSRSSPAPSTSRPHASPTCSAPRQACRRAASRSGSASSGRSSFSS